VVKAQSINACSARGATPGRAHYHLDTYLEEAMSKLAILAFGIMLGFIGADLTVEARKRRGLEIGISLKTAAAIVGLVFLIIYVVTS
jgi:hypothetical protein